MVGDNNQSNAEDTNSEIRKDHFLVQEAVVSDRKILAAFNGALGTEIATQKGIPLNCRTEFRDTADLSKLFHYHKDKIKIINIIQQGSCYHLDPIEEETQKSDLDAMLLRGNHKLTHSETNPDGLGKAIGKDINHRWALPLTI